MTYTTGSVSSSATPSTALADLVEVALTNHANWTKVDDRVHSTIRVRLWQCSTPNNGLGVSFYVGLYHFNDGSGNLFLVLGESWDSTNGYIVRPAFGGAAPTTGAPEYLPTGTLSLIPTGSLVGKVSVTLAGTYTYGIWVTNSAVAVAARVSSTTSMWAGVFSSALTPDAGINDIPLAIMPLSSTATGRTTRHPKGSTSSSSNLWTQTFAPWTETSGVVNGTIDNYHAKAVGARTALRGSAALAGIHRGFIPGTAVFETTGLVIGDVLEVAGIQHAYFGGSTAAVFVDLSVT